MLGFTNGFCMGWVLLWLMLWWHFLGWRWLIACKLHNPAKGQPASLAGGSGLRHASPCVPGAGCPWLFFAAFGACPANDGAVADSGQFDNRGVDAVLLGCLHFAGNDAKHGGKCCPAFNIDVFFAFDVGDQALLADDVAEGSCHTDSACDNLLFPIQFQALNGPFPGGLCFDRVLVHAVSPIVFSISIKSNLAFHCSL